MKISGFGIALKIFVLCASLIAVMNCSLFFVIHFVRSGTEVVKEQASTFQILQVVNQVSGGLSSMRYWLGDLALTTLSDSEEQAKQGKVEYEAGLEKLAAIDAEVASRLKESGEAFFKKSLEAVDAYSMDNKILGNSLVAEARAISQQIDQATKDFLKLKGLDSEQLAQNAVQKVIDNNEFIAASGFWLMTIATLVAGIMAWMLQKSVTSPIKRIMGQLSEVSVLTHETSNKLRDASQKSATAVTEQGAAIQQTVASAAEMSSMLSQTAQHTSNAAQVAGEVSRESDIGTQTMQKMSDSMDQIARANEKLGEITRIIEDISTKTNVINDIAFKTQLLSVNASIEAARAGQHGKGFAVVANEVGNLANMSGKAANDIRLLLNDSKASVSQIVQGTDQRIKSGQTICTESLTVFERISGSITTIHDRVKQINEATKEQEAGVKQMSLAMNEMNEAASTYRIFASENASLSSLLAVQAERLSNIWQAMEFIMIGRKKPKIVKPRKQSELDKLLSGTVSAQQSEGGASTRPNANVLNIDSARDAYESSQGNDSRESLIARIAKKVEGFGVQTPGERPGQKRPSDKDQNDIEKSA